MLKKDGACAKNADGMIKNILTVLKHVGAITEVKTLVNLTAKPLPFQGLPPESIP